jgi:ABC-type transporter Mla MlaB component
MGELAILLRTPSGDNGSTDSGPTELGICGPLTRATTPALRDYLRQLLIQPHEASGPGGARVRLDMSCCTNIDLDGLLALAVAQHAAQLRGGDLHLVRVPPLVDHYVRQHNFDHLLTDPST